jgi:hypothetical protein
MIAAFAIVTLALPPATASAQGKTTRQATALAVPITGTVTSTTNTALNGALAGTMTLTGFAVQNGVLMALGTITGTVTNGTQVTNLITNFAAPVAPTQASCSILSLTLAPLHLDLLGLVVDLPNPLVVNITAVPGPGNLLGNLLCAVAGLLDPGTSPTAGLANLLNRLLAAL